MSRDLVRENALQKAVGGLHLSLRDKVAQVLVHSIDADWNDEVDRAGALIIADKIMLVVQHDTDQ